MQREANECLWQFMANRRLINHAENVFDASKVASWRELTVVVVIYHELLIKLLGNTKIEGRTPSFVICIPCSFRPLVAKRFGSSPVWLFWRNRRMAQWLDRSTERIYFFRDSIRNLREKCEKVVASDWQTIQNSYSCVHEAHLVSMGKPFARCSNQTLGSGLKKWSLLWSHTNIYLF